MLRSKVKSRRTSTKASALQNQAALTIDSYFSGIESVEDIRFTFRSSDVTVRENFELPITLPVGCDSVLNYKFSSSYGNLEFGVLFVDENDFVSVIMDIDSVDSLDQIVEGEFQISKRGVVYLIWENTFSWLTKQLSYSVDLLVKSFTKSETETTAQALDTLREFTFANKVMKFSLKKLEKVHQKMSSEVQNLVRKVEALEVELAQKRNEALSYIQNEVQEDIDKYVSCRDHRNGLFIRCFNKALLLKIFSFIPHKSVALVCKYWKYVSIESVASLNDCSQPLQKQIPTDSADDSYSIRVQRYDRHPRELSETKTSSYSPLMFRPRRIEEIACLHGKGSRDSNGTRDRLSVVRTDPIKTSQQRKKERKKILLVPEMPQLSS